MRLMFTLNPSANRIKPSATLAINQRVQQLRQQGQKVYHWGFGQSPFPVPQLIVDALKQHANQKDYLPGLGLPALRNAAADYYRQEFNYDVDNNQIVIGPGSKELIFDLLYLIEGELLLPAPSWVSYAPQAMLLNKPYRWISTTSDDNYCISAEELEKACLQSHFDSKLLILNSPNNPTGCVHHSKHLSALADVCRRHNVIVISDEIYAKISFGQQLHDSLANYYPEGTFVTSGLSKLFAAGGYRLGVCLVPNNLRSIMKPWSALISETFSCVSTPIQYAATAAYQHFDQLRDVFADYTAIQQVASRTIYKTLIECDVDCAEPNGAFYLMPDFSKHAEYFLNQGVSTSDQLANWFLDNLHIATLPGIDFGMPAHQLCLRIAAVDFDGDKAYALYQQNRNQDTEQFSKEAMSNIVTASESIRHHLTAALLG